MWSQTLWQTDCMGWIHRYY